ncbi:MAG: DNA topoisomerase (ATP-hydrolyzing) [Nitriliruptorales bacterium]|nr:DNA topoisomerase (ATP-hydrolyzing) [Nitriliruptorales bacterium]
MARQPKLVGDGGTVKQVSLEERMEQAFLDYSMSVIVGRALPDVRDGLKPVQRRILYSMWESGLRPDRPYRKCASAVGEVMKKYHPHGDTSIYDALVRMTQDFSTRELLVDGHGNFGSVDGDPPAAMRYTEARLSKLAMELLDGIDEDTVDFTPNYDGYDEEPVVLPARFPNLLTNGASGIAVGMATNIAPHNLGELIDACVHLIEHPDATLDDLMELVPAPDFPTGARIIEDEGIREAFESGRGQVTMEAVATTEVRTGNLPRIVVTEIPYQVNKSTLLEKIADLVQKKKIEEIRDLRDESSRDGMRIVIELKRGEDPARVLAQLYQSTDLRSNFNVNQVTLVDGEPRTIGLKEALEHYLDHQREVLTRRTTHRLEQAQDRAHVLEGLLAALDQLDEVIALIRASQSAEDARQGLMDEFELTERQARAVLDMQLRRLAALERAELEDEYQDLLTIIEELQAILDDDGRLATLLIDELTEIRRIHATPRRSRVVAEGIDPEEVLAGGAEAGFEAQEVTVFVTEGGYIKMISERRTTPAHSHPHDPAVAVVRATTDETLLLVDAEGGGFRVDLADYPVVRANQRGTHVAAQTASGPEAAVVGAVPIVAAQTLVTVSAAGQVKRTEMGEFADARQRSIQAAGVKDGDRIRHVLLAAEGDQLMLATSAGLVTRFPVEEVRTMGRTASGVIGMNVPDDAEIVAASVVPGGADDGEVLTVGAQGNVKRTPLDEYSVYGRGAKGVQTGVDRLLWCGVAGDLHLGGDEPRVLRPVDIPEGKRTWGGAPLDSPVGAPVVREWAGDASDE